MRAAKPVSVKDGQCQAAGPTAACLAPLAREPAMWKVNGQPQQSCWAAHTQSSSPLPGSKRREQVRLHWQHSRDPGHVKPEQVAGAHSGVPGRPYAAARGPLARTRLPCRWGSRGRVAGLQPTSEFSSKFPTPSVMCGHHHSDQGLERHCHGVDVDLQGRSAGHACA